MHHQLHHLLILLLEGQLLTVDQLLIVDVLLLWSHACHLLGRQHGHLHVWHLRHLWHCHLWRLSLSHGNRLSDCLHWLRCGGRWCTLLLLTCKVHMLLFLFFFLLLILLRLLGGGRLAVRQLDVVLLLLR